ncbi:MAG TPA: DUF6491 family protein [Woeseiaceae bacterium]|nr:DUF6491 family protein [Woeseiaceae bacterium]
MQTREFMTARRTLARRAAVTAIFVAVAVSGGCGLNPFQEEENEAVLDFIHANELAEVGQFRYFQQFSYVYVSDSFVTVPTYSGDYLVEFAHSCPELRQLRVTPDMMDQRHDNRTIRARFDTIRGCRIGKIYEISEVQAAELEALGDAPGDDLYIDEDEARPEPEAGGEPGPKAEGEADDES